MIPAGRTDLLHGIARDLDIETGQIVSCESKICTLGPSNSGSSSFILYLVDARALSIDHVPMAFRHRDLLPSPPST